jgi:CHAD domain-containing protein
MSTTRFHPAPDPAALVETLASRLRVEPAPPSTLRVTHLDTFDWRLFKAGARLTREREGRRRRWVWTAPGGEPPRTLPATAKARFSADLPPGWLKDAVAPLLGPRALLEVGEVELERQLLRVVDGGGNTTLRVWWERLAPLGPDGRPTGPPRATVRLEPLPDHDRALATALEVLAAVGAVEEAPADDLALAVAARGRRPGDYSPRPSLDLVPSMTAASALRSMLGALLATARANLDGVEAGLDTEFLHDLRVAVRRSRSALTQLEGVLPAAEDEPLAVELRWLGTATGPCRDLDVFSLDLEGEDLRLEDAPTDPLAALREAVARDRAAAHRELVTALRSDRCGRLLERWAAVAAGCGAGPLGAGAVRPLADERIVGAFRRVLKRGRRLGPSPATPDLHRLRIAAKRFRYLLELFRSLYPEGPVGDLLRDLRQLQDVLGGVQDTVVQLHRLGALGDRLLARGNAGAATLLAMGRLAERIANRQQRLRAAFAESFAEFAGQTTRDDLERLVAAGEGGTTCG